MENQHRKIAGYRELNEAEIELMNEGKELAEKCREYIDKLDSLTLGNVTFNPSEPFNQVKPIMGQEDVPAIDGRWVSIGQTHLQQGFMALVRAIAKPTTF